MNEHTPQKSKTTAVLLTFFFGGLGVHKFYLGYTVPGVIYLLINTVGFAVTWMLFFIPNIVLGFIVLIEFIIYLTKSEEDFQQTYVIGNKPMF